MKKRFSHGLIKNDMARRSEHENSSRHQYFDFSLAISKVKTGELNNRTKENYKRISKTTERRKLAWKKAYLMIWLKA